jgi:hypothetical protein
MEQGARTIDGGGLRPAELLPAPNAGLESKQTHARPDSLQHPKHLSRRLVRHNPPEAESFALHETRIAGQIPAPIAKFSCRHQQHWKGDAHAMLDRDP